ncbi:MAG TPA: thioredoxin family protein [Myxococcaceae bacterium]|nr:thioredoxin family protein [Myxococcaceae bacterium]
MRSRSLLTLLAPLALMGLAGCSSCANKTREASPPADASAEVRAAAAEAPVPFIHDDYPAALAEARKRGVPLFIDFWAPWCHTCRHMNANVFPDPGLSRQGEHYVFLSVDTEKPQNAEVVKQFPVQVWPTLLVIDPREETAVLKWLGSADLDQLNALLDDARLAMKGGEEGHSALLARADRLAAQGEPGAAAAVLAQLLEEVPRDWPRRSRAVESRLMVLALGGAANPEACARLALDELAQLPKTSSWARIASWGLGCALEVEGKQDFTTEVTAPLEARVKEALAPSAIEMAGDDRSGLYMVHFLARQQAGDSEGAQQVGKAWGAFLEQARADAPTPDARAVYDGHLTTLALELGKPELALEGLRQSEAALPGDYNPPARLALILGAMGQTDAALEANGRALQKVYGPRKVRVLNDRASLLREADRSEEARASAEEALALIRSLPEGQRSRRETARAEKLLSELPAR